MALRLAWGVRDVDCVGSLATATPAERWAIHNRVASLYLVRAGGKPFLSGAAGS